MKHLIIGKGRLGKTLLNSLKGIGQSITETIQDAEVIWITTPDSAIESKVKEIEKGLNEKHILVHCSGFFPSSILKNKKTDKLASLHPAFSFPKPLDFFPQEIFWAFEGNPFLFDYFAGLVLKWKGKVKQISENQKTLYHIACVFASNFPIVSLLIAEKLFEQIGLKFSDIKEGLVNPVCKKVFNNHKLNNILTGPAKRKDIETIMNEIEVLKGIDKDLSLIYKLLSDFVLKNL